MRHNIETKPTARNGTNGGDGGRQASGSQTLLRGLDVLEGVAEGPVSLADLAAQLGLTRSTTHRLANALIERRYLVLVPQRGYQLGPKLLERRRRWMTVPDRKVGTELGLQTILLANPRLDGLGFCACPTNASSA
jgi:hypothetical protein